MDPIAMLTELADATASVSKEITQRSAVNNSASMQRALIFHRLQELLDKQRIAVNDEDLEAVRRMAAVPDVVPNI